MNHSLRLRLLWIVCLPVSVLALGMLLERSLPRPQEAPLVPDWHRLGAQAFAAGDMQSAVALLNQSADRQGLQPEGWIMLGQACFNIGDWANALRAWQSAGDIPEALQGRLSVHNLQSDYPAALADLQALASLQPEETRWAYQLGLLLAATRPEQAIPYLERVITGAPTADKEPAQTLLRRIQAALPASQPAYIQLEAGRGLADLYEWKLAAEAFRSASQLRPDYAEAWAFLGEALQHIAIPEDKNFSPNGLDELKFAVQLDPGSLSANLFLAIYYRRQGQYAQAVEILENLAKRNADQAVVQIELGNTLAAQGDPKTALPHYVSATELAPAEPSSWLALAGFSVSSQYQVRQVALPAARQLLLLSPADPAGLDLMGQALLILEDPINAERFFLRAIQADFEYAPAHLHLAQVYILRGEDAAAQQEVERVCNLASIECESARRLWNSSTP